MPRPEELRLTEFASDDSDADDDIFSNSIIHRYENKVCTCFDQMRLDETGSSRYVPYSNSFKNCKIDRFYFVRMRQCLL